MRRNGYAPIRDYALLGDGRASALVALDGSVDWFAVPDLDSAPLFAALLDAERGGRAELHPAQEYTTTRRYLPDTNVLESTFTTASGVVTVTDVLNLGGSGRLPWAELARRVEGRSGEVELVWSVSGSHLENGPWVHVEHHTPVLRFGDVSVAVCSFDLGEPVAERDRVHGRATVRSGETALLALPASADGFLTLPNRDQIAGRLDGTAHTWREWTKRVDYSGKYADEVVRSALALDLLLYSPNGAIAAAPTTSLPESPGGSKNWDYRFAWLRDASFSVDALLRLGLAEEAHAALAWLLAAVEATAPHVHVFYSLDGGVASGERNLPADGYLGAQPVRVGNSAAGQLQLGSYGDLVDAVWQAVCRDTVLDERTGRMLAAMADQVCELWQQADSGIWELGETRHYTISKIGCWVALDRAARMAERGQIATRHAGRWERERDAIHAWVDQHCWSSTQQAYTFYAGSDELDASVLLAARTGFCPPGDARLASTVDAVRRQLGAGPFLYRYTGMAEEEGAFLACSFWLVEALRHTGREAEAERVLDEVIRAANDVGLFAEQLDPGSGDFLGNTPQGLTHLALVLAVTGA